MWDMSKANLLPLSASIKEDLMKPKLTLKHMLIATACCVLLTAGDLLFGRAWTSPRDFKTILYWIILLIGWAVFFLDKFKHR